MTPDHIEKKVLLHAPLSRVWRALVDSTEFGSWFGINFNGPFLPGASLSGTITGSTVNAEVAKAQKQQEGKPFSITIEQIEPERLFSFRWHPHAVDPGVDYSSEPTTLVTFTLAEGPDGVLLTVVESGFDGIPLSRRAQAFSANEGGWAIMVTVLGDYVGTSA
jgi:uncharacterized protein YndB with AHSA1/START domain